MKKQILFLLAALSIGMQSCKDKDEIDACVKNFAGKWSCSINSQYGGGGGCSSGIEIEIRPGDNACEVFLPNLPYTSCSYNSNYLVKGTVEGDSLFVYSQPFGLHTVSATSRVYLNQITCTINLSNGTIHTLSGSKID